MTDANRVESKKRMNRIGVFICHCGINIASVVDIETVTEIMSTYPGVTFAKDYQYMCSEPGQDLLRQACTSGDIDGVVIAACSPQLHEATFRRTAAEAEMNPYRIEMANIREQCAWVHAEDRDEATRKAIDIIRSVVERTRRDESLIESSIPVTKKALVVGAGISGMKTALDIAGSGYQVYLLDRQPSIGGHMAQLSETFPTLDCAQ
jgi:heterodisulfide reductase subunit A